MSVHERQVTFTPEDRAASIYQYVPFEVAAGQRAVGVDYRYPREGAVVDLGLFDPNGFRGWSGGARTRAVVAASVATPGYLPGPLPAGTWQVVLGLHRVPAPVTVTITVDADPPPPPPPAPPPPRAQRPPPRDLPARPGHRWLAADLHTHTQHSDGRLTVDELAALAASRGVDVLAITDHNTVSHHPYLRAAGEHAGIFLLPGQEVTTDAGHANCFGDIGWVDFRDPPDRWLATAQSRGAVMAINHPLAGDCAWTFPEVPPAPLIELWHHTWDRRSLDPLRWFQRHRALAIGGSDFHDHGAGGAPGQPTTWIEVPDDPDALDDRTVLDAITSGTATIAAEPRGPLVLTDDDDLVVCDAEGLTLATAGGHRRPVRSDRERLVRGEGVHLLVDGDGLVHALSA